METNENSIPLSEDKRDIFHSITAKLLFITKRVRPDIEPTVAFLCTRVSKSDIDDWKQLRRLLGYIRYTINDVRIIGAKSIDDLATWIDAAYAIHNDMA